MLSVHRLCLELGDISELWIMLSTPLVPRMYHRRSFAVLAHILALCWFHGRQQRTWHVKRKGAETWGFVILFAVGISVRLI